jgi:hypothetical protein
MLSDSTENPSLSVLRAADDWLVLVATALAELLAGVLAEVLVAGLSAAPLELHAARAAAAASARAAAATLPLYVGRVTGNSSSSRTDRYTR